LRLREKAEKEKKESEKPPKPRPYGADEIASSTGGGREDTESGEGRERRKLSSQLTERKVAPWGKERRRFPPKNGTGEGKKKQDR